MSDMRQVLQEAEKALEPFVAIEADKDRLKVILCALSDAVRGSRARPDTIDAWQWFCSSCLAARSALARIRASLAEGDPVPEKTVTEADERDRYFRNAVADALDEYDGGDRDRFNLGTLGSGFFHSIRFRPGELKAIAALIRPAAITAKEQA